MGDAPDPALTPDTIDPNEVVSVDDPLNLITDPRKRAFLAAFTKLPFITKAARIADIYPRAHYRWVQNDPVYASVFDLLRAEAVETLEAEATRRAVEGWDEPVYGKDADGNPCVVGYKRRFSDDLLKFRLKAEAPEKYDPAPRAAAAAAADRRTESDTAEHRTASERRAALAKRLDVESRMISPPTPPDVIEGHSSEEGDPVGPEPIDAELVDESEG